MKVFKIKNDVEHFQWLLPDVPESEILDFTTFDCTPKANTWKPPEVFCLYPLLKKGDFLKYGSGNLLVSPKATELVRTFFEMSGELLPLWYEGEQYNLLNVLECVNVLDINNSEWILASDGSKVEIKKYRFLKHRFTVSSIFKIPETRFGDVLTWENDKCLETEFKTLVEANNLTGLVFEELWDSEKETDSIS